MTNPTLEINSIEAFEAFRKTNQEALVKAGTDLLNNFTKSIFEAHPELEALNFKGYEIYFNDGDTTYYIVGDSQYKLFGEEEDFKSIEGKTKISPTLRKKLTLFENLVETLDETVRDIFGDHKEFTITRNGISVEDYTDHD